MNKPPDPYVNIPLSRSILIVAMIRPLSNFSIPNRAQIPLTSLRRTSSSASDMFPNLLHIDQNLRSTKQFRFATFCSPDPPKTASRLDRLVISFLEKNGNGDRWKSGVENLNAASIAAARVFRLCIGDRISLLLGFASCSILAFISLVVVAVPTLKAMRRAALSLAKLEEIACEELPNTMAAIRLSSAEISDLLLELRALSQDISEGVPKSAKAVQEAGSNANVVKSIAHRHTISRTKEWVNLPSISLKPVVFSAARKNSLPTSNASRTTMSTMRNDEGDT